MKLSYDRIKNNVQIKEFIDLNLLEDGIWLAGGALRSVIGDEPIADYDLFFRHGLVAAKTRVELESKGFETVFKCPEGKLTTYKKGDMKVQCITENYYPSMQDLLDTFDISACRYATDGTVFISYYSAIRDTLKKQINLHRVDYPVATLKRVAKYAAKGYKLTSKAATYFTQIVYDRGVRGEELNTRVYID